MIPYRFEVYFDDDKLEPTIDPELYKGKVRVFHKYSNRNGSYISDEYAEQLAVSAYHKPIIGSYSIERQDFKGHTCHEEAKAYGYVIPDSLEWTLHEDKDGVSRSYATYDILVWAKYWEEAKTLFQKTQSMEIDPDTIKGEWKLINGDIEEFVYTEGVMAGLCILGDHCEPCFHGAAFFSTDNSDYKNFMDAIKNYYTIGGKDAMNVKVAGLEHANFASLWDALNPNFNEDGAYLIDAVPCEITETEVLAMPCGAAGTIDRYSYSVSEEGVFSIEKLDSTDYKASVADFEDKLAASVSQFEELQTQFAAIGIEKETLQSNYEELQTSHNDLVAKCEQLAAEIETLRGEIAARETTITEQASEIAAYELKEKDALISKFSGVLPVDTIQEIEGKKSDLSVSELNTALALEYTNFSLSKEKNEIRVPQIPEDKKNKESDLAKILKNYRK